MVTTVIPGIPAIKDFVGKSLGTSEWITVTQERIDRFAEATDDHQWIHVDPERAARESPFGRTVAHGYLTLSLAPALLAQIMVLEGYSTAINVGVDKMRLSAPVPAGARVRMHAELKGVRDIPRGGARCILHFRFEVEGVPRPACTVDAIYAYYP